MKQLLWVCSLIMISSSICAHWKIGTIIKPVNITIESAWYIKSKNQPKQITGLTSKLVAQKGQNTIIVNHTVGDKTGECAYMIAQNKLGQKYKIAFDGPSTYAVHSGRLKTKIGNRTGIGKQEIDLHTYDYMARVFLYQLDDLENENLLSYAVKGFSLENSDSVMLTIEISDAYKIRFV